MASCCTIGRVTTAIAPTFSPVLAAAVEERGSAVVSLHDVAPPTREASQAILDDLRQAGVPRCSLLVVPDYHHRGSSMADAGFVRWLRDLEADGHEIVVHGYYHQRERRAAEGIRDRFVTRLYTNDEGEFYDISYEEARERLKRALNEFGAAGFRTPGFIAPAWLLSEAGAEAARECEFEYTTRLASVSDLRSGETYRARSLVYSVRNEWRRQVSRVWNQLIFSAGKRSPLLRLSIHPPDILYPGIWQQILRFARQIAATRDVMTYAGWIAQTRTNRRS